MIVQLNPGRFFLIQGPGSLEVRKGIVEVFGKKIQSEELVSFGNSVYPVCVIEGGKGDLNLRGGSYKEGQKNPVPESWIRLMEMDQEFNVGTTVVLGHVDSGKSSLILSLSNSLLEKGISPIGILDTDVGQGKYAPGLISLFIVTKSTIQLNSSDLHDAIFLGVKTPSGNVARVIMATKELIDRAYTAGAKAVFVDTSGYVHGQEAILLKQSKIQLVANRVVNLESNDELATILKGCSKKIHKASIPETIIPISREVRIENRRRRFESILKDLVILELPWNLLKGTMLGKGRSQPNLCEQLKKQNFPVIWVESLGGTHCVLTDSVLEGFEYRDLLEVMNSPTEVIAIQNFQGTVVGLESGDGFLGLGILEGMNVNNLSFSVRVPKIFREKISSVTLGQIRIDYKFSELSALPWSPWNFWAKT